MTGNRILRWARQRGKEGTGMGKESKDREGKDGRPKARDKDNERSREDPPRRPWVERATALETPEKG